MYPVYEASLRAYSFACDSDQCRGDQQRSIQTLSEILAAQREPDLADGSPGTSASLVLKSTQFHRVSQNRASIQRVKNLTASGLLEVVEGLPQRDVVASVLASRLGMAMSKPEMVSAGYPHAILMLESLQSCAADLVERADSGSKDKQARDLYALYKSSCLAIPSICVWSEKDVKSVRERLYDEAPALRKEVESLEREISGKSSLARWAGL